jgi:hypothetical protein
MREVKSRRALRPTGGRTSRFFVFMIASSRQICNGCNPAGIGVEGRTTLLSWEDGGDGGELEAEQRFCDSAIPSGKFHT